MNIVNVRYGVLSLDLQKLKLCFMCCVKDILLLNNGIKNYPCC